MKTIPPAGGNKVSDRPNQTTTRQGEGQKQSNNGLNGNTETGLSDRPREVTPGPNHNGSQGPPAGMVWALGMTSRDNSNDVASGKKTEHASHLLEVNFRVRSHSRLPDQIHNPFLPFIPR